MKKNTYFSELKDLVNNGMLEEDDVQLIMAKARKKIVAEKHPYKIYQGADGRWMTNVPDSTKKEKRRRICKTTKEALYDALFEHYMAPEKERRLKLDRMTFETLYPEWLEYKKQHTKAIPYIKRIHSDWKKYYKDTDIVKVPIKKLKKIDLDEWAHKLIKEYSMTRKCWINMSIIMRQGLRYAAEKEYIERSPMDNLKISPQLFRGKKKKADGSQIFSKEEINAIINKCWDDFYSETKDYVLSPLELIFSFYTGVRIGEGAVLRYEDIEGDYVHVQRMFRRDTGEILPYTKTDDGDRYIFLPPEAVKVIEAAKAYQQAKGYDAEGYIFAINGNVFKDRIVNTLLQKYAKQLGISYRSSHKARKSYGSVCIDGGVGIDTVRQMLGHSDERTTLNYYCYDTDLDQERKAKLKKAVDFTNFTQCPQSVPRKF